MTEADPERLLTEALRAQAAQAPVSEPTGPVGGFGLLSGSDLPLAATQAEVTARMPEAEQPRAWWVLGLAVMLGLAAGAVVGVLTLL
ncbi:hypothetical protein L6E12_19305 [Actinokineospora sp. PR83]|uniref:hypothetical protein n=1 Tax=Actinokineospora sp. PR83 TaxID=2884908 RepID=UPI001F467B68|nr:hypothetical protein [Actinokineospora sp. PR83]MCG8917931.1 hypothetical protein [Actinokineospora sp. PR83]